MKGSAGRLYEAPVVFALAAVTLAIGIGRHSLLAGLGALIIAIAVLAGLLFATAGLGAVADKAGESERGRQGLKLFKVVFWFLLIGAFCGFAAMLAASFFVTSPAVLGGLSAAVGIGCGAAGGRWMSRSA